MTVRSCPLSLFLTLHGRYKANQQDLADQLMILAVCRLQSLAPGTACGRAGTVHSRPF